MSNQAQLNLNTDTYCSLKAMFFPGSVTIVMETTAKTLYSLTLTILI